MWNTLIEEIIDTHTEKLARKVELKSQSANIKLITEIETFGENRIKTGIEELDRVLGGGIVGGSVRELELLKSSGIVGSSVREELSLLCSVSSLEM